MNAIERTKECRIGGRVFLIFTEYSDVAHKLNSTVKYQSRIVRHDTLSVDEKHLVNIEQLMDDLTREIEDELEQLYVIADKVTSIKHELSSNKMGLVFLKYHLYDDAIECFKQAVEIKPDFSQALNNLGKTYLRMGRYSEALHVFRQGGKAEERYADLNKYIGDVHYALNQYELAVKAYDEALKINPDYELAHLAMGRVQVAFLVQMSSEFTNRQREALQDKAHHSLVNAAELMPPFNIGSFDLILAKLKAEEYRDVLNLIQKVHDENSDSYKEEIESEFYLKFMFGGKGKDEAFISRYATKLTEMIQVSPEFADLHNNLGITYLIQCRNLFLKALDEFRQAIKVNPDFNTAKRNLRLAENDGKGFLILLRALMK